MTKTNVRKLWALILGLIPILAYLTFSLVSALTTRIYVYKFNFEGKTVFDNNTQRLNPIYYDYTKKPKIVTKEAVESFDLTDGETQLTGKLYSLSFPNFLGIYDSVGHSNLQIFQGPSAEGKYLLLDDNKGLNEIEELYDFLLNYMFHGPEIFQLQGIRLVPQEYLEDALGVYSVSNRVISIGYNTELTDRQNYASTFEVLSTLIPVIAHEYGHHFASTYFTRIGVTYNNDDWNYSDLVYPSLTPQSGFSNLSLVDYAAMTNAQVSHSSHRIYNKALTDRFMKITGMNNLQIVWDANFKGDHSLIASPYQRTSIFRDAFNFKNVTDYPENIRKQVYDSMMGEDFLAEHAVEYFNGQSYAYNAAYLYSYQELFARYFMLATVPMLNLYRITQIAKHIGGISFAANSANEIESLLAFTLNYSEPTNQLVVVQPWVNEFYQEYKKLVTIKAIAEYEGVDFPDLTSEMWKLQKEFDAIKDLIELFKDIMGYHTEFSYLYVEDSYSTHIYGYTDVKYEYAVFRKGPVTKLRKLITSGQSNFMNPSNVFDVNRIWWEYDEVNTLAESSLTNLYQNIDLNQSRFGYLLAFTNESEKHFLEEYEMVGFYNGKPAELTHTKVVEMNVDYDKYSKMLGINVDHTSSFGFLNNSDGNILTHKGDRNSYVTRYVPIFATPIIEGTKIKSFKFDWNWIED